ncbi:MAG TPA: NTP transferase domain-containing protein [Candidatus Krumholzibacteria bacterium]|nr:NTP transferase domain-containing protein [Candidatus Krumholzibacteria bacterium]
MKNRSDVAVVILAAGQGKRMNSDLPKVLHAIGGRPMIRHVIDSVKRLAPGRVVVVTGYQADRVEGACGDAGVEFARQHEQLGTGHAVMQTEPLLGRWSGCVLVLNGDVPGLRAETVDAFIDYHRRAGATATVLTAEVDDPAGYGRIVRGAAGGLERIVEQKDASPAERAIREINSGLFCFEAAELYSALARVTRRNAQNEYYLTDVVGLLHAEGRPVAAWRVDDAREVAGVNNPEELEAVRRFVAEAS